MHNLTPTSIELIDCYDDGKDTRHYTFRLMDSSAMVKPLPGQFFILYLPGVGAAPFTYTTHISENGTFQALVRRMGSVTTALFECATGCILGARGPFGKGWPLDQLTGKRILIIAGGCGLAPLVGITEQLVASQNYEQLALLYGAASKNTQVLNPERKKWGKLFDVYNVVEDQYEQGLAGTPVDVLDTVLSELRYFPTTLLLCGPEIMMQIIATQMVDRGMRPQSIWLSIERRMHCGVGLCGHCYQGHHYACKDGPTYRWDTLQMLDPFQNPGAEPNYPANYLPNYHC